MSLAGAYIDPIYIVIWALAAVFVLLGGLTLLMLSIKKELKGIHGESKKTSHNTDPQHAATRVSGFLNEQGESRQLELYFGSANEPITAPIDAVGAGQSLQHEEHQSASVFASSDTLAEQTVIRLRSIGGRPGN